MVVVVPPYLGDNLVGIDFCYSYLCRLEPNMKATKTIGTGS